METRILQGIQPFNDFFYKSCFFNSFFPIVKYYGGELFPYIFSDLIVYKEKDKLERKWIDVEYIPLRAFDEILLDSNINVSYKFQCNDVINNIKTSINRGNPVIIWIDCYYQSIRPDTYGKKHLAHTLLIYGYDDGKKCFHVIEHTRYDSLTYAKREASYTDINNSYQGYFQHLSTGKNEVGYYEFSKGESPIKADLLTMIANFQSLSADNKEQVSAGLKELFNFVRSYSYQDYEQINTAKIFLEFLNNIMNVKKIENYRISLYADINSEQVKLNESIISDWNSIRASVAKYVFSSNYHPELFEAIYTRLCDIYEKECRYFELEFDK